MLFNSFNCLVEVQNNLQDVENGGSVPKTTRKINIGESDEMVSHSNDVQKGVAVIFLISFFKIQSVHEY
jgi:hypothetical protein